MTHHRSRARTSGTRRPIVAMFVPVLAIGAMAVVVGQLQGGTRVAPAATTVRAVGLTVSVPQPAPAIKTGPPPTR